MHTIKLVAPPLVGIVLWVFIAAGVFASFSRLAGTNEALVGRTGVASAQR
jgi:hypothetical protein